MQLVTLERRQARLVFWAIAGFLAVAFVLSGEQEDPGLTVTAILLAAVSVWPFYLWLTGQSSGLPIWPVFAAVNGLNSAMPIVQDAKTLTDYSSGTVFVGAVTIAGFILLGTLIWLAITRQDPHPPKSVLMIGSRHAENYLFLFAGTSIAFALLQAVVTLPDGVIPVLRSLSNSLTAMGLFTLAFYRGRGMLGRHAQWALGIIGALTMLVGSVGLLLINSLVPLAMLVLGYMLGSNTLPWRVLLVSLLALALLHAGKYKMRAKYWGEESPGIHLSTLPQFYWEWFVAGLEEGGGLVGTLRTKSEEASPSMFERVGNLHMLLVVQQKSPREVPFLGGVTYEPIPRLLIPRIIDEDKGFSHAGNVMLTMHYGLQTIEQTRTTSIFWGIIPESYANYGYTGVFGLAVLLSLFYGYVTRLTVGVPMTTLRFLIGLLVTAAATKADTMGVFVTTQFQGILGVTVASLFLMKRRGNPFATEAANGGPRGEGTKGRNGLRPRGKGPSGRGLKGSRDQGAKGLEAGMPAPGVLAGLIEGAQPEGADQEISGGRRQVAAATKGPRDQGLNGPREEGAHEADGIRQTASGGCKSEIGDRRPEIAERLAADGGTVRAMPVRMPKRVASWMPRRVRQQVAAEQQAAADQRAKGLRDQGTEGPKDQATRGPGDGSGATREKPRQLAVPYQHYRRHQGA